MNKTTACGGRNTEVWALLFRCFFQVEGDHREVTQPQKILRCSCPSLGRITENCLAHSQLGWGWGTRPSHLASTAWRPPFPLLQPAVPYGPLASGQLTELSVPTYASWANTASSDSVAVRLLVKVRPSSSCSRAPPNRLSAPRCASEVRSILCAKVRR